MNITVGSVVYIDTDEGESIDLRKVDSVKIYPETDRGNNKNIGILKVGGQDINATGEITRSEAETLKGQILAAQQSYNAITEGGISSIPPEGTFKVTNIYVDPSTGRLTVQYDNLI